MLLWPDTPGKRERQRFNPRPPVPKTGWKLVNEFPSLRSAKAICFDVETKDSEIEEFGPGWGRGRGHIIGVAIGTDDGFKRYYPIRHEGGPNCDPQHVLGWLNEELSRPHQHKVGHNVLYDLGWLAHEGVKIAGTIHDTWTAEKILRHSADATLEECGQRYLGEGKESDELYDWAWSYWGRGTPTPKTSRKLAMSNLFRVPPELVGFYAESDVELPLRILPEQMKQLEARRLWDVYRLECDLLPLLVQMRLAGVSVDVDAAEQAKVFITKEINLLQKKVDEIAGHPVNTGSPIEMGRVFDRLGIEYPLTEKAQKPQLKAEFLKTLEHPIGQMIVDIEEFKKMRSTFVQGYILDSNVNGKIHGEFNPLRAVTGRMSSSNPNLQNIPSRTDLGKKIREIFIPDAGHDHIRKYDYASVESRILAHYAVGTGSRELRKQYNNDPFTDYHQWTIDMVKKMTGMSIVRKHAKIINFGLCIAEGQLVLTDMGLVPIENISLAHRIWDGVEFVSHEGVIDKGIKEVTTYQGLTATPDHKVWLDDGSTATLGEAQKHSRQLARTATAGGFPILARFGDLSGDGSESGRRVFQSDDAMSEMREAHRKRSQEHGSRTLYQMSMLASAQLSRSTGETFGGSLSLYGSALHQRYPQAIKRLQGSGNQGVVRFLRTLHSLGAGNMAGLYIQEAGVRPYRQQRTLLSGQSPVGVFQSEQNEHQASREAFACICLERKQPDSNILNHNMLQYDREGYDGQGDSPTTRAEPTLDRKEKREGQPRVRVYDILNAGPRRRFTCSGVLVSNCYGASENKLSSMLGISKEEAEPLFEAFHGGLPYVRDTMEAASRAAEEYGYTQTVLGRRALFDRWEPKHTPRGAPRPVALKFNAAVKLYGPNIKRAYLHKAINYVIQGSAADLMKSAMVTCLKAGIYDVIGVPRLVVHDEVVHSVPEYNAEIEEAYAEMKHVMETAIKFRIPIKVEGEWGPSWGKTFHLD